MIFTYQVAVFKRRTFTHVDVHTHVCMRTASTYGAVCKLYASHTRSKTCL